MAYLDNTTIGVIIVTYRSADVIIECLASLLRSDYAHMKIIVCDNHSPDDTVTLIRAWAVEKEIDFSEKAVNNDEIPNITDLSKLTLLVSARNRGYAGGVNIGLSALLPHPQVGLFWILNPDTVVTPDAASAYAHRAASVGPFALMGGRTIYQEPPNLIESDGGRVNLCTGMCSNVNQRLRPVEAIPPIPASLDLISGANFVASRGFVERAGRMREDYFLYCEEVDWAFRRGNLPLATCPEAVVYKYGGTAIGAGSVSRRASAFAEYFNNLSCLLTKSIERNRNTTYRQNMS